jgi:hypothetical protein
MSRNQKEIKELQQKYANAKRTHLGCNGHFKALRNGSMMDQYEARLYELGSAPDPALEGVFNGKGAM